MPTRAILAAIFRPTPPGVMLTSRIGVVGQKRGFRFTADVHIAAAEDGDIGGVHYALPSPRFLSHL